MGRATSAVDYATAIETLTVKTRAVAQWWADGFDLLVEFRAAYPALPVVVMSAYTDVASTAGAFRGGAHEPPPATSLA